MRRMLIFLAILAAAVGALAGLWIFQGAGISSLVDRYWTVEIRSIPIQSIAYEGSGSGGNIICNSVTLSLNDVRPDLSVSIGSTKDNQLALASSGKVFAFGPLDSGSDDSAERLATALPSGDRGFLTTRHSLLSWPTLLEFNFMTGKSPSWKRHIYQEIHWKKSAGANLEMVWRYEQFFYPGNGWTNGLMTRQGSTGLIQVDINQ